MVATSFVSLLWATLQPRFETSNHDGNRCDVLFVRRGEAGVLVADYSWIPDCYPRVCLRAVALVLLLSSYPLVRILVFDFQLAL